MPDLRNALPKPIKTVVIISVIYAVLGIALALGVSASEREEKCHNADQRVLTCLNDFRAH